MNYKTIVLFLETFLLILASIAALALLSVEGLPLSYKLGVSVVAGVLIGFLAVEVKRGVWGKS